MGEVKLPNPGSSEAINRGCTCPVLDNSHGRGWMGIPGVFVWREDCPLHKTDPCQHCPDCSPEFTECWTDSSKCRKQPTR